MEDFIGAWPGGVAYAREVGKALADCDCDALQWSSFDWTDNRDPNSEIPMAKAIAEASGKPMIANGGIAVGKHAETVIESGAGDPCAVGLPLFAHPDWPHMIRSGEAYDWIPFDRKYVICPPIDYRHDYLADRVVPDWNPDTSRHPKPGWMKS